MRLTPLLIGAISGVVLSGCALAEDIGDGLPVYRDATPLPADNDKSPETAKAFAKENAEYLDYVNKLNAAQKNIAAMPSDNNVANVTAILSTQRSYCNKIGSEPTESDVYAALLAMPPFYSKSLLEIYSVLNCGKPLTTRQFSYFLCHSPTIRMPLYQARIWASAISLAKCEHIPLNSIPSGLTRKSR